MLAPGWCLAAGVGNHSITVPTVMLIFVCQVLAVSVLAIQAGARQLEWGILCVGLGQQRGSAETDVCSLALF